jgi:hypothetical protein
MLLPILPNPFEILVHGYFFSQDYTVLIFSQKLLFLNHFLSSFQFCFHFHCISFTITVNKYLTNNLKEEGFILGHGFREFSLCLL